MQFYRIRSGVNWGWGGGAAAPLEEIKKNIKKKLLYEGK